jgi:hypothetical protein
MGHIEPHKWNDKPEWFDRVKKIQKKIDAEREKIEREKNRGRGWEGR